MGHFTLTIATKLYFGSGITTNALQSEKAIIKGNVLVVTTGRSLRKLGYLENLKKELEELSTVEKVLIYEKVSQNPEAEEVEEAVRLGKDNRVAVVIGFGGGSAIDAAKAAAVGIVSEDTVENILLNGIEPSEHTLPIVAIPTTAGTGSELSKAAILSSAKHGFKGGIRGNAVLPAVAVVDPKYTYSVPIRVTMETGFDALAHAIESYLAVKATLFSEMLSEKAICIIGENIRKLHQCLQDYNAREQMSYASMIMGINLANVGTCLPHRMQYVIGVRTHTTHGAGLLALYPSWMRLEYTVNAEKVNKVLEWLGLGTAHTGEEVYEKFRSFLLKLDIAYTLSDLGITEEMLEDMTVHVTGNIANDKLSEMKDSIFQIYRSAL